jgi:hypothetical protein
MSWSLAALGLVVIGSVLLTVGTAAQAWANFTGYQDLYGTLFKRPVIVIESWRQMVPPARSKLESFLRWLFAPWWVFILFWVPPKPEPTNGAQPEPTTGAQPEPTTGAQPEPTNEHSLSRLTSTA